MGTDTMTAVCQNPDCGHLKAQHASSGLCTDEECWNVGSDDVRDSTCRAFVAPVAEPGACHCGEPIVYGYDGDPTHHRGMCWHCDAVRCDAYPGACKHEPPSRAVVETEASIAWETWARQPDIQRGKYSTWDAFTAGFLAARGVEQ